MTPISCSCSTVVFRFPSPSSEGFVPRENFLGKIFFLRAERRGGNTLRSISAAGVFLLFLLVVVFPRHSSELVLPSPGEQIVICLTGGREGTAKLSCLVRRGGYLRKTTRPPNGSNWQKHEQSGERETAKRGKIRQLKGLKAWEFF